LSIGLEQLLAAENLLCGLAASATKSLALFSVSVQPANFLIAAVLFAVVGAGPVPSKQLAVDP